MNRISPVRTAPNFFAALSPCTLITVVFILAGAVPASAQGNATRSELLKRHAVAVYDDDGNLLGSGASVSATGLILTAKHILEQRISGQRALSYRMSVNIKSQRDTNFRSARLVATHPHMDIAILSAPEGELIPPLLIGTPENVSDKVWFAIGHPRGTGSNTQRLFVAESGQWSSVQLTDGWYVIGSGFDTGMSGGPVIVGDRIVGIVSYASSRTYIVPLYKSLDFFDLLGFSTTEAGAMRQQDHVGILAGKVQKYEQILSDIQVDRQWICVLDTNWNEETDRMPSELSLTLHSEKRLRSQPEMSARIGMDMKAEFLMGEQRALEVKGNDVEWVKGNSDEVTFGNIVSELKYGLQRNEREPASLNRLNFRFSVSRISGSGLIRDNPNSYSICCSFSAKDTAEGVRLFGGSQEAGLCDPSVFPESKGENDETPN